MKIEAGKFYRTRDGRKVGPMFEYTWFDKSDDVAFIETEGDGHYWSVDGKYCKGSSSDHDLIAELADEPETSTLAELNVKPGDVVVMVGDYAEEHMTIEECPPRSAPFEDHWDMGESGLYRDEHFRVISRASQSTTPTPLTHSTTPTSPVRTVTRKEIVPGVYGAIRVYDDILERGHVCLGMVNVSYHYNTDELTAAIETLTEIRDAINDQ